MTDGITDAEAAATREELRLALVLNGGVSLAVWISGVVNEVDALRFYGEGTPVDETDATGAIYLTLKDLLNMRVAVDVIAGTSAGGLNGALMAAGIATQNRVSPVRETWIEQGQLSDLLRSPSESEPPSLLKGDERMLPLIQDAIKGYFDKGTGPGPKTSVRVTLPTTDLFGVAETPLTDSYGDDADRIERRLHQRFHSAEIEAQGAPITADSVAALARAARSSSSFPFAFEPSEIAPTQQTVAAVFAYDDTTPALRLDGPSRWTMDGGVLDNSPIDIVLGDIQSQPAGGSPVRRTMIFIVPYAGHADLGAGSADQANLRRVLETTINSPRDLPDLENLDLVVDKLRQRHRTGRQAENLLLRLAPAGLTQLAGLCGPAPADAIPRMGRRALDRIRAARANLPMIPDAAANVTDTDLEDVRKRLKIIHVRLHTAIWGPDQTAETIAAALREARAQIERLTDLRPPVYEALPQELAEVTAERLEQADTVLQAMAVTDEDRHTDAGFRFMRLCADAQHPGQRSPTEDRKSPDRQPSAKLYGLGLGHFGGFVRRSWRANDWMWGRLDGAARLVDIMLAPSHLADHRVSRRRMKDELTGWLSRIGLTEVELRGLLPEPARWVLDAEDGPILPGPAGTGSCADRPSDELRAWRHAWRIVLQTAILRAELKSLTDEVKDSTDTGFRPNPSPGVADGTPTLEMIGKFRTYCAELDGHIHEIVKDEANSRQGARMLATAVAVTGGVLGSRTNGFPGLVSAALRTTRGALKVGRGAVYAMTGSVLQRAAFIAGVALAAVAVGIATVSDLKPAASGGGGSSGSSMLQGVALTVAVPIIVVALAGAYRPARRGHLDRIAALLVGAAATLTVFALVLWLWGSPLRVADGVSRAHTVWWAVIVLVAVSTVVGWIATLAVRWEAVLVVVAVAAAGLVVAGWLGGLNWAVKRWGGACSGGIGTSCMSRLGSHAVASTELRLALAAVVCFLAAAALGRLQQA